MDLAYVFKASWIFFVAWSTAVLALVVIAFGRDLLPSANRDYR